MLSAKQIKKFQKEILDWYAKNKRNLPWRVPSGTRFQRTDPYKILVSEVMSQQTQINRIIPKYEAWIKTFPTIHSLAKANTADVLRLWSGLGYNRRALYLQKSAQILIRHSGLSRIPSGSGRDSGVANAPQNDVVIWPKTEEELVKLPGIGKYTARAILCFAFNKQVAVVDTNVKKVIITQFICHPDRVKRVEGSSSTESVEKDSSTSPESSSEFAQNDKSYLSDKEIEEIAGKLLPGGRASDWNQALMDYAAVMLKDHKIFIPKQSTFRDSDRFYRGQIMKLLTRQAKIPLKDIEILFSDVEKKRLKKIILSLEKDKLIVTHMNVLALP
jgi:A/G-specific adenine glycosylase